MTCRGTRVWIWIIFSPKVVGRITWTPNQTMPNKRESNIPPFFCGTRLGICLWYLENSWFEMINRQRGWLLVCSSWLSVCSLCDSFHVLQNHLSVPSQLNSRFLHKCKVSLLNNSNYSFFYNYFHQLNKCIQKI